MKKNVDTKQIRRGLGIANWYKNLKLREKLLVSFILVSIIPIMIIQFISTNLIADSMENKISDLTLDKLEMSASQLNITLTAYTDILYQVYIDDIIAENINIINENNEQQYALAYNIISKRIKDLISTKQGIRSITIVCNNGNNITYDSFTASAIENLWKGYGDLRDLEVYKNALNNNNMALTSTSRIETYGFNDDHFFHISKKLFDLKDLNKGVIGVVIISIDEEVLRNATNLPKHNNENSKDMSFIIDKTDRVVSFPIKRFIGTDINEYIKDESVGFNEKIGRFIDETRIFNQEDIVVNHFYDVTTDWILVDVYVKNDMFEDIFRIQTFNILIGVIAITTSLLIITYTIQQLVKAVYVIVNKMKEVQEGDLSVQIEVDSNDEISDIARRFNKMVTKIKILVEEVKDATNKQKEAEIRALEAQINPHFLYNTLDSINWMAIEKEEHEISKMLKSLGIILRYSIDKSNHIVTIHMELQWLKQYVELQQQRFDYSFEYKLYVDDQVLSVNIYKLLIQPFIENAIIHGFEGIEIGGRINIDIIPVGEGYISITIEDNGKGMSKQLVNQFNCRESAISNDGKRIGMNNAFARIDMYYGKRATWKVISFENKGTVVFLKIPILT